MSAANDMRDSASPLRSTPWYIFARGLLEKYAAKADVVRKAAKVDTAEKRDSTPTTWDTRMWAVVVSFVETIFGLTAVNAFAGAGSTTRGLSNRISSLAEP